MTPGSQHPDDPKQYICDDDDLGCLHDYMVAALAGNDVSELPRLWNQQIGVIRSHPHTSARSEREIRADVISKLTKIKGSFSVLEMRRSDEYKEAYDQINELVIELRRQPPSQQGGMRG